MGDFRNNTSIKMYVNNKLYKYVFYFSHLVCHISYGAKGSDILFCCRTGQSLF